jgi:hypothetical protein
MRKLYYLLLIFSLLLFTDLTFGQTKQTTCGVRNNYFNKNLQKHSAKKSKITNTSTEEILNITVVFHVVYNTPEQNLHDSIILNQMNVIKNDFRRMNSDTTNMRSQFESIVGDSKINLILASEDPNGNPTNGITRTQTSIPFFDYSAGKAEEVKFSTKGGIDPWDSDRYLNIWICNMTNQPTPSLYGYASPNVEVLGWDPSEITERDGVVMQYQLVGTNNPNSINNSLGIPKTVLGRIGTHEVGHYFGLHHIFEDGCNNLGDGIEDTPKTNNTPLGVNCDVLNSCTDNFGGLGDLPDMYENFMDYSSEECQNSFTKGQITFMRSFIKTHRSNLLSTKENITDINEEIDVFTNPIDNSILVKIVNQPIKQIELFDQLGRKIKSVSVNNTSKTISNIPNGFFVLRITLENNHIATKKIVL